MSYYYYLFGTFLCGIAFLIWLASLVIFIAFKNKGGDSPEKIQLKKRLKDLNIALIILMAVWVFIWSSILILIPMAVLAVLCVVNSLKLLKITFQGQAYQQVQPQQYNAQQQCSTQQVPPQQNNISRSSPQQEQQPQQAQQQQARIQYCPSCGGENKAGSFYCVHCGNKI